MFEVLNMSQRANSFMFINLNEYESCPACLIDNAIYSLAFKVVVRVSRLIDNVFNLTSPAGLHMIM